jgi:hypothetical protein
MSCRPPLHSADAKSNASRETSRLCLDQERTRVTPVAVWGSRNPDNIRSMYFDIAVCPRDYGDCYEACFPSKGRVHHVPQFENVCNKHPILGSYFGVSWSASRVSERVGLASCSHRRLGAATLRRDFALHHAPWRTNLIKPRYLFCLLRGIHCFPST